MSPVSGLFLGWTARCGALALSLAAHIALLAMLLVITLGGEPAAPPPRSIMVELTRLPPPLPRKEAEKQPERHRVLPIKPMLKKPTIPVVQSAPPHEFTTNDNDWVMTVPGAGTSGPRRAPPDYADKVKTGIISNLFHPSAAVYEAPRGFKGDPKILKRQCTVPYEIVVDRNGKMISHHIEPCGDDLLDAAAEAALLKSGPFPPPPDLGAEQYVIYGSANFRVQ